jgi:Phage capsid family
VVQVENEELLYHTGTGHFAGFFSTSGILRHNLAGATDTTALDAIEQAIEQMRSGPALAEPDLFITSPSSWSALRRIKDDLHRYILSPDPTREEANQLWGVSSTDMTAGHRLRSTGNQVRVKIPVKTWRRTRCGRNCGQQVWATQSSLVRGRRVAPSPWRTPGLPQLHLTSR